MPRNLNLCFTIAKSLSSPEHPPDRPIPFPNVKNFNSLYDTPNNNITNSPERHSTSDSDIEISTSPDIATAFASNRFFFSSPGRSNSIIDSSSLASTSSSMLISNENDTVAGGSIAVPTYSPDPFMDFRQSMQEMVEARDLHDVRENWDYLHELLMCYLSLNPKSTHKFIVGAFADLLVSLTTSMPETSREKYAFSNC